MSEEGKKKQHTSQRRYLILRLNGLMLQRNDAKARDDLETMQVYQDQMDEMLDELDRRQITYRIENKTGRYNLKNPDEKYDNTDANTENIRIAVHDALVSGSNEMKKRILEIIEYEVEQICIQQVDYYGVKIESLTAEITAGFTSGTFNQNLILQLNEVKKSLEASNSTLATLEIIKVKISEI